MTIFTLKCPNCKGDVQFDVSKEEGYCTHCRSIVMRDNVIAANICNRDAEANSFFNLAKQALIQCNDDKFVEFNEKALAINANISDGWFMKAAYNKIIDPIEEKNCLSFAKLPTSKSFGIFTEKEYSEYRCSVVKFNIPSGDKYTGGLLSAEIILDNKYGKTAHANQQICFRCAPGCHKVVLHFNIGRGFSSDGTVNIDVRTNSTVVYDIKDVSKGLFGITTYLDLCEPRYE